MKRIQITGKSVRKFEDGYPVVNITDLENRQDFEDGAWVQLENHGHFVATAYFAKQHRGAGYVLSLRGNEPIDERFFASKFRAAQAKRAAINVGEAYRFFNDVGDGLGGLIIDVYQGVYVFRWQNAALKRQARLIYAGFQRVMGQDLTVLAATPGQEALQVVTGKLPQNPVTITEAGVAYPVDLTVSRQQLALEFRDERAWARENSAQQRILNLYSAETGVVTAAMAGDATEAVTVDPTNRATTALQAQLAANNLDQAAVEMRTMDVANYLDYAIKHELTFDTVFVNPPAFIRGKKHRFDLDQDLGALLTQVLQVTHPGSQVLVTTTAPGYSLKKLRTTVSEVAQNYTGHVNVSMDFHSPADFMTNSADRQSEALKGLHLVIG